MRIGDDKNIKETGTGGYHYREDRLANAGKKKKKGKLKSLLIILGYIAALILIMLAAGMLLDFVNTRLENSAKDMAVSVGAELLPEDQEVTLTQAQLDEKLKEAAESAAKEAQDSKAQAVADARAEILNGIKAGLSTGDETMVEVLRPYYPDEIVVVSNGKFNFVPINQELKKNDYKEENLQIQENGEYLYIENDEVVSHKGIDVSRFQGDIDWKAVAADGVEFAFIRVGNRGYGTGKLVEDDKFEKNVEGALAAGIHTGVYIYSQAISEEEIREEAQFVLEKLKGYEIDGPVVFDVEKTADSSGRMNQISLEERTNLTLLFCQTIEQAGYKPMIYHNIEMGALMIDVETLEQYDKWLAYYNDDMYYPYAYSIWQYTDKGKVNGIKGNVDMNISFGAFWEE